MSSNFYMSLPVYEKGGVNDGSMDIKNIDAPFINLCFSALRLEALRSHCDKLTDMQRPLDIHFPANIKSFSKWLRTRQSRN